MKIGELATSDAVDALIVVTEDPALLPEDSTLQVFSIINTLSSSGLTSTEFEDSVSILSKVSANK